MHTNILSIFKFSTEKGLKVFLLPNVKVTKKLQAHHRYPELKVLKNVCSMRAEIALFIVPGTGTMKTLY